MAWAVAAFLFGLWLRGRTSKTRMIRAMRRRIVNQRARLRQLQDESTMNLRIAEQLAERLAEVQRTEPSAADTEKNA